MRRALFGLIFAGAALLGVIFVTPALAAGAVPPRIDTGQSALTRVGHYEYYDGRRCCGYYPRRRVYSYRYYAPPRPVVYYPPPVIYVYYPPPVVYRSYRPSVRYYDPPYEPYYYRDRYYGW
jgi:hypothetical protein